MASTFLKFLKILKIFENFANFRNFRKIAKKPQNSGGKGSKLRKILKIFKIFLNFEISFLHHLSAQSFKAKFQIEILRDFSVDLVRNPSVIFEVIFKLKFLKILKIFKNLKINKNQSETDRGSHENTSKLQKWQNRQFSTFLNF